MNATGAGHPRVSRVLVERYLDRLRRRRRWRRLSVTITVFLALLALTGYSILWHTKVFDVRTTTVSGVKVLSRQQVLAAAAIPAHAPVAAVDTAAAKARLMALPRVKDAWVERSLPHTVSIGIVERTPAAALPQPDGSFQIVDADGVAFDTAASASAIPAHVPVIHLEQFADPGPEAKAARAATVAGALAALRALPPPVLSRVLTVSATGPYAITVTLTPSTKKQHSVTVAWGGPDQPVLKARILAALIGNDAAHYDLSAPAAPAYS
ncbi:Polypeptide-transport-associated domain protein FtsQ-type [Catenulispora acidiphila DSM 44928]|uniref:Polypeptide-transport-associated domain protein FtsQ-type n=1 Tax=Catenulispora acidiphila (strain DSM 44928 / JCM 14897 / NBRC 102108 / NRRL B-24433 / ID139908) TaxID=479433 RepID=C7QGT0_CATAD|nr:FtsQ-type POTRA domain-containing protein [Catenulispora acidiphila]ACU74960.1 Polypeptide-transport-associated domain protein FtsQ-type [Catenulispora acidiphila DSM 44928]